MCSRWLYGGSHDRSLPLTRASSHVITIQPVHVHVCVRRQWLLINNDAYVNRDLDHAAWSDGDGDPRGVLSNRAHDPTSDTKIKSHAPNSSHILPEGSRAMTSYEWKFTAHPATTVPTAYVLPTSAPRRASVADAGPAWRWRLAAVAALIYSVHTRSASDCSATFLYPGVEAWQKYTPCQRESHQNHYDIVKLNYRNPQSNHTITVKKNAEEFGQKKHHP